ncbi:hypothetical protein [uncultured Microbacterium sp.]|uniref:hypothetical protein n=1 Tax=uncultured Microbacterium sp. TaxID=191216 RepID=UPI002590A214|nr:hypothetical protein [uncultured Microbacterium sp.]
MKTVLYPAIALMNRLSFGMKFSLISVLFFLPMLVTNFYLVRDSYRQFVGTENALESLELLGQSLQLRRDLESLNDLVQINSMIGQSGQAGDLESRIGQLQQALSAGLQGLEPVTQDAEQAAEFVSKRDELLADLKSAEGETSLQSKAVIVEKLLGSSQVFIKLVASQAGLSQDPQRQVRQITELITNVTPQITDVLSQGRAIGAYSLGQGFLNSAASTKFDDLLLQLEKLHAEYGLNLQEALAGSVAAQNGLGGLAEASRQSLKDSGVLFEDMFFDHGGTVPAGRFIEPRIEAEIAFIMDSDLAGAEVAGADVVAATGSVAPALEILDTRIFRADPETGAQRVVFDTISDNAANAGVVLGDSRHAVDAFDLRWVGAITARNGEVEETGLGAGVLNDPVESMVWLVRRLAQYGDGLRAGDVVLSGSFIRPIEARNGDSFRADYGPFGAVHIDFA